MREQNQQEMVAEEEEAAKMIQARFRGQQVRKSVTEQVVIAPRGNKQAERMKAQRDKEKAEEEEAAVKIQARYRANQVLRCMNPAVLIL